MQNRTKQKKERERGKNKIGDELRSACITNKFDVSHPPPPPRRFNTCNKFVHTPKFRYVYYNFMI